MSTRTSVPTAPPPAMSSPRDQYLNIYDREHAKTLQVLRAYPREKSELRPHPKARTARELAATFVNEQRMIEKALTTGFDWSKPTTSEKPPESLDAICEAFDKGHQRVRGLISVQRDAELCETVQFPTGPGRIGDHAKIDFLWMMLHDQIHHRGQFSVYLRMADGKVPAIYGPSLDEPWF